MLERTRTLRPQLSVCSVNGLARPLCAKRARNSEGGSSPCGLPPVLPCQVSRSWGAVSSSDAWLAAPGEKHEVGHRDDVGVVEIFADGGVQ